MIITGPVTMTLSKQNVMDAVELWLAQHFKVPPKVTELAVEQYKDTYTVTFEQHESAENASS